MAILVSASLTAACASPGGGGGSKMISQEQRAADTCLPYVQTLAGYNDQYKRELDSYVAAGAGGGAILGALGAAVSGGDTGDIVGAAVVGGIAGAVAGYLVAKNKQTGDKAQLRGIIEADARASSGRISVIGDTIAQLGACRRGQIAGVDKNYRAKKWTREQAQASARRIEGWIAGDDRQIAALLNVTSQDAGVYTTALAQESGRPPEAVLGQSASYRGTPRSARKKAKRPKAQSQVQERYMAQKDVEATRTEDKKDTDQKMASLKSLVAI